MALVLQACRARGCSNCLANTQPQRHLILPRIICRASKPPNSSTIPRRVLRPSHPYRQYYSYRSRNPQLAHDCAKPVNLPFLASSPPRPSTSAPLPLAALMTSTQTRNHAGHGHGHSHGHGHGHHHHHHDNVYLTARNKSDPGVRITRIGLLSNLGMAIGKGIGGYMFHSQALVADAYHALTDLVSDFMTLATVSLSLKPPTEQFPTGFGKVETLGALGVSGLLLCGGVLMGLNAVEVLVTQFFPEVAHSMAEFGLLGHGHSHSHSHGHEQLGPHINAAWLAAGSIVIKEWLYQASKLTCLPCVNRIVVPSNVFGLNSNESRQTKEILCARIQRRTSSSRLSHQHRRFINNWRSTYIQGCVVARPCGRLDNLSHGY